MSHGNTNAANGSGSGGGQDRDESLRNMDIDAAENHMKEWFGDHANWSHEKLLKLFYIEELLPVRHQRMFASYAHSGNKPGGGTPSFPLMTTEEHGLLNSPYSRWAPAPYDNLHHSCNDKLHPLFTGRPLEGLGYSPRIECPARLRPLKAKIMLGMAPISRDRWLERKMDNPANYRNLFELMKDVIALFRWYNDESVLRYTRESFNWMVEIYVEFGKAANLRRQQQGIEEKLDFAGMWAEYWAATWNTMSDQTHRWIVDRVDEVQSRAFAEYCTALSAAGGDDVAIREAGKRYYECVQDLRGLLTGVDYTMGIPMTGFTGYGATDSITDLPLTERQSLYMEMLGSTSFVHQAAILQAQDQAEAEEAARPMSFAQTVDIMSQLTKPAHARFRDTENLIGHYMEGKTNRDETRLALRGELKPSSQEYWITILKDRLDFYLENKQGADREAHRWGFVVYRLTYEQTEEEWTTFMDKFHKDVSRSGEWIAGADTIMSRAGLTFIDGRDVGIAEGDIEAAKRHFKSTFTMLPTLGRMWTQDFLVVDKQSYQSYAQTPEEEIRPPPPYGPGFGCNGGHVRLVDAVSDKLPQDVIDASCPGYKGQVKVLSSLVFEEVYPLLATLSLRPYGLWPVARLHAREVYVGTTDASQEGWWEWNRIDRAVTARFFEDLRKKKAALLTRQS